MKTRPSRRHPLAAFTLIELLTVIAIIGILAAIIIPTVSRVRATARNAQCVSRMRDWGSAIHLFANDNKGKYQSSSWLSGASNPYLPYFPAVLVGTTKRVDYFAGCPIINQDIAAGTIVSYAMIWPSINGNIATLLPKEASGTNQFVPLNKCASPSKFLMMCDSMSGSSARMDSTTAAIDEYVGPLFGKTIINPAKRGDETVARRHGGTKINGVFGDGSVKPINGLPETSKDTGSIYAMRTVWFQLY